MDKSTIIWIILMIIVLIIGYYTGMSNWNECRAAGFSILYCLS